MADRLHLLQNATTASDGLLRGRRLAVEEAKAPKSTGTEGDPEPETAQLEEAAPERPLTPTKRYQAERRAMRTARRERVRDLHQVGMGIRQIAREVGISRKTVRSLLAAPEPPSNRVLRPRAGGLSSPNLQTYMSYLQDRWQQGCTNVSKLSREIQAIGCRGSRSLLAQAVQPWRGAKPPKLPKKERRRARQMTRRTSMRWICLKPPVKLKVDERVRLEKLLAKDDELALGYDLLQRFRQLLRNRDLPALDQWLQGAAASDIPTFMALANGIKADWSCRRGRLPVALVQRRSGMPRQSGQAHQTPRVWQSKVRSPAAPNLGCLAIESRHATIGCIGAKQSRGKEIDCRTRW